MDRNKRLRQLWNKEKAVTPAELKERNRWRRYHAAGRYYRSGGDIPKLFGYKQYDDRDEDGDIGGYWQDAADSGVGMFG